MRISPVSLAWWHAVAATLAMVGPVAAQSADDRLAAQGSMSLNIIWTRATSGALFANASHAFEFGETRYGGRIALRVVQGIYVGASVTSWQFSFARAEPNVSRNAVTEGVVLAPYIQVYPLRRSGVFVRAGAGYLDTWTYFGGGYVIQGYKHSHMTATGGLGIDVPVRRHLALTLSADYIAVEGMTTFAEANTAIVGGIGFTVR